MKNKDEKDLNQWRDLGLVNDEMLTILNRIITLWNFNDNECVDVMNHLDALPSIKWLEIASSSGSSKEFSIQLLNLQTQFTKPRESLKTWEIY